MKVDTALTSLGLTNKEALVYTCLLSLGEASKSDIARATGIKRPTTYLVLEQLNARGLLIKRRDNKRVKLRAASPFALLEKQQQAAARFANSIPALLGASSTAIIPEMKVLAGSAAIEEALYQRLNSKTELLFWADNDLQFTNAELAEGPQRSFMKLRIKQKLWIRGLIPYERSLTKLRADGLESSQLKYLELRKKGETEFRDFVFVSRQDAIRSVEIWVYDQNVEFYSAREFIGARITSQLFADTMRGMFVQQLETARAIERELLREADLIYLKSK